MTEEGAHTLLVKLVERVCVSRAVQKPKRAKIDVIVPVYRISSPTERELSRC